MTPNSLPPASCFPASRAVNPIIGPFAAGLIVLAICVPAQAQYAYRIVARTGQTAPGTAGAIFDAFNYPPLIDENGRVSIYNQLKIGVGDATAHNYDCVFSEGIGGTLQLVARTGMVTPGNVNYVFSTNSFTFTTMSPNGLSCFMATASGSAPPFYGTGIWAQGPGGALTYVGLQGETLPPIAGRPELAGAKFDSVAHPAMSATGDVVFIARLKHEGIIDGTNDEIIIDSTGGGPYRVVAWEGDPAPAAAPGSHYGGGLNVFGAKPVVNGGAAAFLGNVTNGTGGWCLFSETLTMAPPRVVACSSQQCPGLAVGTFFGTIDGFPISLNGDGYLAFRTVLSGPSVNVNNDESLWLEDGGALHLVAREGEGAPGGGTYWLLYPPELSGTGWIAFAGWLNSGIGGVDFTNDVGIYLGQNQGNVVKIMREGDPAPIPNVAGITFGGTLSLPSINNSNMVAFRASLRGGSFEENTTDSIWVSDAMGNKTPVALRGQSLEVTPGVFKTIRHIRLVQPGSAAQDGEGYYFNNAGQLAFSVTFTDATVAVVVASPGGCVVPQIGVNPFPQSVCNGGTAQFFVAATGDAPLTYQWRRGMMDLMDGGNISGAQTDTLTINPVGAGDVATDYNCVVSNGCGDQTSQNAALSLTGTPMFSIVPISTTVLDGTAASFTVQATGLGSPNYQWRKGNTPMNDGGNVFGANGPILTINPVSGTDAGNYDCVLSSACGMLQTAVVTLTVTPGPPPIPPAPAPLPGGGGVTPPVTPPPGGQPTGNTSCGAMGGGGCGAGMMTMLPLMMVMSRSMRRRSGRGR